MFVIVVYDISTIEKSGNKRLNKIKKVMRKYLQHTQKSVFEGELTEGKLLSLKKEVYEIINEDVDYVVFYIFSNPKFLNRFTMGLDFTPDNFI